MLNYALFVSQSISQLLCCVDSFSYPLILAVQSLPYLDIHSPHLSSHQPLIL